MRAIDGKGPLPPAQDLADARRLRHIANGLFDLAMRRLGPRDKRPEKAQSAQVPPQLYRRVSWLSIFCWGLKMNRHIKTCVALTVTALPCAVAHAVDFDALAVGQPVADNVVGIGRFHVQLPDGRWTVLSKLTKSAGTQTGSSATPTQLTVAVGRASAGYVSAVMVFNTPANTFQSVSRWNDDPCATYTRALVKDTMGQTFSMPECFAITNFAATAWSTARTEPFLDIHKWMTDQRLALAPEFFHIFYTKYQGGDFFKATLYLPGSPRDLPAAELWGRAVAQSLQSTVKHRSLGLIPSLPEFTSATTAANKEPQLPANEARPPVPARSAEARMQELKSLLDKGLITTDDYNDKRKKILSEL